MRRPKKTVKIPTLFGLTLLLIALVLGIAVYFYQDQASLKRKVVFAPKQVEIINLSPDSATITWQTDTPVEAKISFTENGPGQKLSQLDDRDKSSQIVKRITHFVTLKNLKASTKYFYQIEEADFSYPDLPTIFQTTPQLNTASDQIQTQMNQPITGTVLDLGLKPVDEALVFLDISGASKIGTFITTAGNFILPLKGLLAKDLKQPFNITDPTEAQLQIIKGNAETNVQIVLPLKKSSLSAIQLGRNINLQSFLASNSAEIETPIKSPNSPSHGPLNKFDLNSDGKINSVDLSIILDNLGKRPKVKGADLNVDGIVDQKDIELLKPMME